MSRAREPTAERRTLLTAALLLVAAVLLAYVPPALRNGFASDDTRFVLDNPHVLSPAGAEGWLAFLHDPRTVDPNSPTGIVRPLRTLELAVDHAVFGLSPAAFHLHSVLWHVVASVLVLLLLRRLTGRTVPAAVGAAVWALHPMQVQSVAWISSRGDVAMGACVAGALLLELRREGIDWGALLPALALGAVGMLYKETAVVLPLLVFAVRLVRPATGPPGRVAPAARAALPYLAVAALYMAYRSAVQIGATAHADTFVLGGSTAGTFATMFRAIGAYIAMTLLPVRSDYDWYMPPSTTLLSASVLAWLAVLVALVAAAVLLRARRPRVSAAICLFLFPLIPVANWPFQIGIPTAERFLYLPLLGLGLLVAAFAGRRAVLVAATAAAVGMGVIAARSSADWRDDHTLLTAALRHGTSPRAFAWFASKGRDAGYALRVEAARTEDPDEAARLDAEGRARLEQALDDVHRSLDLWHRFETVSHSLSDPVVGPQINAANLALLLGRPGEALWHADRAIAADSVSAYPQPHYNRAAALVDLGRHAEAIPSIARAFELGTRADEPTMVRCAVAAGDACTEAGAFGPARDAYRLVRTAHPELASRGLSRVDAAEHAWRDAPPAPDVRAGRLASVGAEVPDALRRQVADEHVALFVAACDAERRGDDTTARARFERALGADATLPDALRERAGSAIRRIDEGCPAWRDHGLHGARE